jgi:ubiquitin carboxyl-terminal hydrolase 34
MLRVDDKKPVQLAVHNNREYDDNLLHQVQKLFSFLERTDRGDYNPIDFCNSFKDFNGDPVNVCVQQDTQEFVFLLLDRLETALNPTPFKNIISNLYKGKVANLFTCSKCHNTKVREEAFYCLTLEVKNSKNLSESFNKFTNGEVINDFACDFCSQRADVSKKTMVSKLPRVLFIHLQRIVFSLDTFVNEKISTKLEFPFEIDMTPYLFEPIPPT